MKRFINALALITVCAFGINAFINWPFGKPTFESIEVSADSVAVASVQNSFTHITIDTLEEKTTFYVDSTTTKHKNGYLLFVDFRCDAGADSLLFGYQVHGLRGVAGVANKGKQLGFIYSEDKEGFVLFSERQYD